ncbi:ABC transporter permease [Sporosarcina beigongshangi]|uniref:ABC transporter permease n=1 Tax=Sporosarcina beigongshangi TaxID=2782538 RepID=UPI001939BE65|nr:ABC transporter permease [Sporosarcina beigongshangi]
MKTILVTRWMRWQKEWKSLVCWLLLPIVLTVLLVMSIGLWQEEMTVPIGLIVEEQTELVQQLVADIEGVELLHIHYIELEDALGKLQQHELDSVFVIREGYTDTILAGGRTQLIEAYSSNRSYAYQTVVEAITSFAQQDAARSKAAFVVKQLFKDAHIEDEWNYTEIIESSRARQQKEALLKSSFSYANKESEVLDQKLRIIPVWGVWAFSAMITVFFLFDWLLKENRTAMQARWHFTTLSFWQYAAGTFMIYTFLLVAVDIFALLIFAGLWDEKVTVQVIISLVTFRLTINLLAFLTASVFRQLFMYYVSGIAIALILTVTGGAIIPLDGLIRKWPWMEVLSPVHALLDEAIPVVWLMTLVVLWLVWLWKGRYSYA